MTSVGDNLDRCCYIGNRYHDDDTLDVMLIIFIAQLGYRVFKRGCNKIEEVRPFPRYKQFPRGPVRKLVYMACDRSLGRSWNVDSQLKQNIGGYRLKGDREMETVVIQQLITQVTSCSSQVITSGSALTGTVWRAGEVTGGSTVKS